MIRRVSLTAQTCAFRVAGGPVYAYPRGDKAGRERAHRRARRWLRAHPSENRGDAVPKPDARLQSPANIERAYATRIRREVYDPLQRLIAAEVGPVLRDMMRNRGDAEGEAPATVGPGGVARIMAALTRARLLFRPRTVEVQDFGEAIADRAVRATMAIARKDSDTAATARTRIARIDIGRTQAQRAQLYTWSREQANLISGMGPRTLDRLSTVVAENVRAGTQVRTVAKMLEQQFGIDSRRAQLIARTETAKLNSTAGQSAMQRAGATGYVWRTADDERVRDLHAELEGQFFAWDDPPVIGTNGERGHPGDIYNCRCIAEPVFPDVDEAAMDAEIAAMSS